jgi:TRAP-type C4-dicarboxylate transport system substrate-binding protein
MMRVHQTICAFASIFAAAAHAEEPRFVLRMAAAAPDGTSWAREIKSFVNEVDVQTRGAVHVKMYFGGIAGNELETQKRIERGQLDAVASGGMLCGQLSPTYRVMRLRGLFDSQEQAAYVLNRLKPTLDDEFRRQGFVHLASAGLGPDVVFVRNPVHSFDDLKRQRLWRWDLDEAAILQDRAIGLTIDAMPVEEAARAYDEGKTDGFVAVPAAAVAFQWFSRTRYLLDLKLGYLWACLIVSSRAYDRLPVEAREVIHSAAARLAERINAVGLQQDAALLGGLFQRQGLAELKVSDTLRAQFLTAARSAREQLGDRLIDKIVLERTAAEIDHYRAEHGGRK